MRPDPLGDLLSRLDVRRLHVDRADAELLVAEQSFVVRRHVVFDQVRVAVDPADEVRLVASRVEVAVSDLTVVVWADGVVALADVNGDVDVVRNSLDGLVDDVDGRGDFVLGGRREVRLVDLDMLAAGGD